MRMTMSHISTSDRDISYFQELNSRFKKCFKKENEEPVHGSFLESELILFYTNELELDPIISMPAYHSTLSNYEQVLGNLAVLPLKTKYRGLAPMLTDEDATDIIDEALYFFKANVFFRTYEIRNEVDRVLIYITLFITECLKKLQKCATKSQALQEMHSLGISKFSIPGDVGFPLNSVYLRPAKESDAEKMRQYLQQIRQETCLRVVNRVFPANDSKPSKWWLCFAKKKFMDKSLSAPGQ